MAYFLIFLLAIVAIFFIIDQINHLKKLNKVNELINTYEHDIKNPKLIDEMYEFCTNNRKLNKVVKKHNATKKDFARCRDKLLRWGNFRKYKRFVPISSFFAVYTLDYMLSHMDQDDQKFTMRMLNFFNI